MSATSSTKRKYAPRLPPQERKEQLLDTALEIIALQGYPAVSIDAIARRAGVSRPVVYGVWPDLDALLTDLHRRQEQRAMSQVAEAIPPGPGERDPDELLVASFRSFLEAVAGDPLTWRLFLLPIEGMPAAVARRAERTRAALRGQVTQLVAWGVEQRGGPRRTGQRADGPLPALDGRGRRPPRALRPRAVSARRCWPTTWRPCSGR